MNSLPQGGCQAAPKFIFPCSGASEVDGLSDRAARQMTLDLTGKMNCSVGIGGRVEGILANTRSAAQALVIDGCKEECGRKTMELQASAASPTYNWSAISASRKGQQHVSPPPISIKSPTGVRSCSSVEFAMFANRAKTANRKQ